MSTRPLAVVTGASSGIGRELAALCAQNGFDLVIAADDAALEDAATALRAYGARVETVIADLAAEDGVDRVYAAVQGRTVDALLANAGHGLGHAFLDQPFDEIRHVIDTNVTGTVYLIHKIGRDMRARNQGRILITGSIAGFMPGTFSAVYNGTKAFIDSFSFALRAELKDTQITVTCLMPGATETEFFDRAGMLDTKVGQDEKDDPADVAKVGYEAMMKGEADVVSGWKNKVQTTLANVTPSGILAEQHRKMAEPGTGKKNKEEGEQVGAGKHQSGDR
jgi:short-subunit dehydrogenase